MQLARYIHRAHRYYAISGMTLVRPQSVACHHLTTAVAQDNHAIRVLRHQRLAEPTSDVEPLLSLGEIYLSRFARLLMLEIGTPKIYSLSAPSVPVIGGGNANIQRCGRSDTHSGKLGIARKKHIDGHKKNLEAVDATEVLQVVASACRLL